MKITTVLFDLDGTLLPMDQDVFTKRYFELLAAKLAPHGYEAQALVKGIWAGTAAMVKNDGKKSNEAVFWEDFSRRYGEKVLEDLPLFDEFYRTDFNRAQDACGFTPLAAQTLALCRTLGLRTALATNPIFPETATRSRIRWAGLEPEEFELYTTYENSSYCKPNPAYYTQITQRLGLAPEECLMVGNDVAEDMVAQTLGMQVFLLTDCLINKQNAELSAYPHGGFPELQAFLAKAV